MGRNSGDNLNWKRDADGKWKCDSKKGAGYTAAIEQLSNGYELVVTGTDAPSDTTYATRGLAKKAFQKFLHTKS